MDHLQINCEHLVCIPTGLRMHTYVIFKPTIATRESINDARGLNKYMTVHVNDASGASISKRMSKVINVIDEHGTIVATMKES